MTDVNCCPSYTIRAFDVTHLKVKVSLQIMKGSFTLVLIISLAQRKRAGTVPNTRTSCAEKLKYFSLQDQQLIMINVTNWLKFTT